MNNFNFIDDDENSIPVLNSNLQIKELETLVYDDVFSNEKNNNNFLDVIEENFNENKKLKITKSNNKYIEKNLNKFKPKYKQKKISSHTNEIINRLSKPKKFNININEKFNTENNKNYPQLNTEKNKKNLNPRILELYEENKKLIEKKEMKKEEQEKAELRKYSYTPKINKRSQKIFNNNNEPLYKRYKQVMNEHNKNLELLKLDYEEKNSFSPNINKSFNSNHNLYNKSVYERLYETSNEKLTRNNFNENENFYSFQPNLYSQLHHEIIPHSNINNFLSRQNEYNKIQLQKIEKIKQKVIDEEKEKFTFKPFLSNEMSDYSIKINALREDENFENKIKRISSLDYISNKAKKIVDEEKKKFPFNPKINNYNNIVPKVYNEEKKLKKSFSSDKIKINKTKKYVNHKFDDVVSFYKNDESLMKRINEQKNKKIEEFEKKKNQNKNEELKECTFKPNLNKNFFNDNNNNEIFSSKDYENSLMTFLLRMKKKDNNNFSLNNNNSYAMNKKIQMQRMNHKNNNNNDKNNNNNNFYYNFYNKKMNINKVNVLNKQKQIDKENLKIIHNMLINMNY